jgi:hypothetical protein
MTPSMASAGQYLITMLSTPHTETCLQVNHGYPCIKRVMIWSLICMEKVDVVVNLDPVAAVSCPTSDLEAPTCLMHTNS